MPTFIKTPGEVLDIGFDWEQEDCLESAETITDSAWSILDMDGVATTDLVLDSDETNSALNATKAWFSAGVDGEDYYAVNEITTDQGRTFERTHVIKVRGRR